MKGHQTLVKFLIDECLNKELEVLAVERLYVQSKHVKPTFFIRPADMQIIRTDARTRIPAAIHESAKKLIDGK